MNKLIFHIVILLVIFQLIIQLMIINSTNGLNSIQSGFPSFIKESIKEDFVLEDVFMSKSEYLFNNKVLVYFTVINNIRENYLIKVNWVYEGKKNLGWEGKGFINQRYHSWYYPKEKGEWEVLIEVYSSDEKLLTSKKELFKVI